MAELDFLSAMEHQELQERVLNGLNTCITTMKWRIKYQTRRRLETDLLAVSSGLRPVVLVDYGGRMPELQDYICGLVGILRKESSILLPLRAMVVEDMIYVVHVRALAELASSSLRANPQIFLMDIEKYPAQMLLHSEHNTVTSEFMSIQKLFASVFPINVDIDLLPVVPPVETPKVEPSDSKHAAFESSEIIDLSDILDDTEICVPTLNGGYTVLEMFVQGYTGYPVVYLLRRPTAEDAMYNLSKHTLIIYKIFACRNQTLNKNPNEEELMSFTVPSDLCLERENEMWAVAFLTRMKMKLEKCRHVWGSLRMEVTECFPQTAVVL